MVDLYYKIWTDAVAAEQEKKSATRNWKLYTLIPISLLQGINLLTFFYWMKMIVNRNLPLAMPVHFFNARLINVFFSVVITLVIPFIILNYLVIFSNNRYEVLLSKYKSHHGKLYKRYALISIGLFIVPIIIVKMFF